MENDSRNLKWGWNTEREVSDCLEHGQGDQGVKGRGHERFSGRLVDDSGSLPLRDSAITCRVNPAKTLPGAAKVNASRG